MWHVCTRIACSLLNQQHCVLTLTGVASVSVHIVMEPPHLYLPPTNAHYCVQVPSSPLNDAVLHNGSNVHVQSVSASAWPSTTAGSPVGSDYVMVVMSVCASPTFSEVRRQDLLDLPDLSDPPMSW